MQGGRFHNCGATQKPQEYFSHCQHSWGLIYSMALMPFNSVRQCFAFYKGCSKRNAPILFCQPTKSEADVGGMAVEVEPSYQYPVTFCCPTETAAESDKMVLDMEVLIKQRAATIFLHAEKLALTDIYQHLLNVYRDQLVDVSTVRCGWCASAAQKTIITESLNGLG